MRQTLSMLFLCAMCLAGAAKASDAVSVSYDDIPQKNTPRKLQEAWLRFHESGLCQDVDAAFVFVGDGVQIWSRIESDKSYLKFQALFESLRNLHRVLLYTNRPREENGPGYGDDPPPSLWQNYELRANLGDRTVLLPTYREEQRTINPSQSDPLLKQRLLIYAEQTLSRNRKMERYALDLFALARTADDFDIPPDIRSKAVTICLAHAKSLEKSIGKLASDFEQAIPKSTDREKSPAPPAAPDLSNMPPAEEAERIYRIAQGVAARVHRFMYPEYYTVGLAELRKPSLPESLRTLQRMVLGFQRTLVVSGWKQAVKNTGHGS